MYTILEGSDKKVSTLVFGTKFLKVDIDKLRHYCKLHNTLGVTKLQGGYFKRKAK